MKSRHPGKNPHLRKGHRNPGKNEKGSTRVRNNQSYHAECAVCLLEKVGWCWVDADVQFIDFPLYFQWKLISLTTEATHPRPTFSSELCGYFCFIFFWKCYRGNICYNYIKLRNHSPVLEKLPSVTQSRDKNVLHKIQKRREHFATQSPEARITKIPRKREDPLIASRVGIGYPTYGLVWVLVIICYLLPV